VADASSRAVVRRSNMQRNAGFDLSSEQPTENLVVDRRMQERGSGRSSRLGITGRLRRTLRMSGLRDVISAAAAVLIQRLVADECYAELGRDSRPNGWHQVKVHCSFFTLPIPIHAQVINQSWAFVG